MKSIGLLSMFILVLLIGISSLSVAQERKLVVAIPIQAIATYVGQPQPTGYWGNNTQTHPSQWETYLANTDYFVWFYNKNGMLSTTLGQEFTPSLYGTIHNDLEANGLRQLTHDLCIANGTKMVLDIEDLFTTENFFEIIVADAVRSQNFANQVYDYIVANGYLGGVMIDWEWPAGTVSASDFNRFAGMLRAKIDLIPGAILGIWVAPWYPYAGYSNMVSGIDTYFDFAAPMDYSYGNNIHKLGHFMQLSPAAENVAKGSGWDPSMSDANYGLQSWTKTGGIRASKLAMVFTGEARTINTGTGLTPPLSIGYDLPGNIGIYQWGDAGTLRKEAYRKCIDAKVQFGEQWDAAMSSPYVINSDGTKMWQYDNPRSIRAKMDWAISEWDPKYMVVWEMGGWLLPNPPAGHSFGEAWTALSEYRGIIIPPVDTDGDGVIDEFDLCPNTPIGTQVDATGCPIIIIPPTDTDGDGVLDSNDLCPNTPAGTVVDATGCTVNTLDVMPLGDSITELDWEGGYRSELYKMLSDSGIIFDFVGTKTNNHDQNNLGFVFPQPYWDHEGYGSATIDRATGTTWIWNENIVSKLNANSPDVILVLLGTNDLNNGAHTVSEVRDDMSAFLDQIWAFDSNIIVILGSVPSVATNTLNNKITEFNLLLPTLIDAKVVSGHDIRLADHHTVMNTTTDLVGDGIHPSTDGYKKMANEWYNAMNMISTPPPIDSDGDGVNDDIDQCPNTPAGTVVDATGCAIVIPSDSDGDGVIDVNDLCPNTPAGTTVDVNGCEVIIVPPTEDSIILYKDDVINSAWINASWSNTLTFNSTEQSVSGTSMKGIVGAWGAFRFLSGNWATYNNLDPTGYSKVTFSIYALQNSVVKVYLGRQGGTGTFPSINASLTAGVWKDVSINMIDLAPNGDLFNYILLNNSTSSTVTWYVDNLYVEGNGIIVPPADTDGDGVTDDIDQCPNTPPGTIVDVLGCAIVIPPSDSDGDGVTDNIDQCPGTPSGTTVDSVGCAVVIPPVDTTPPDVNITFPINGDTIKGESAINVIATDSFGVKSVEFKINGISIGIDTVIPYTVMWNTNLMSDGIYSIEAIATDISDLISATSISVEVDNITAPPPPPGGEFTIGVLSGWNMISVPTYNKFNNYSRYVLFPTAIGYAYEFNDGYTAVEVLEIGKGYWLKFPITTDVIVGVNEDAVLSDTIDIIVGWNLIGTIGYEVPILNIVSEPGGIIVSEFFEFNGGYVSKNILIPGKAYWVNSSQAGKLILNKIITPPSTNKIMIAPTESQPPQSPKGNGKGKGIKKTNTFSFEPEIKDLSVETYPNPANPYFTTTVNVPHKGVLSFEVYDVLGREVYKSIEYDVEYGVYNYEFGRSLALSSGTYFMVTKLVNGYIILVDKLLLMK